MEFCYAYASLRYIECDANMFILGLNLPAPQHRSQAAQLRRTESAVEPKTRGFLSSKWSF